MSGDTPVSFKVSRKGKYRVSAKFPNGRKASAIVDNKVSGNGVAGVAGNVLVGGLIGIGVDSMTGAALDLTPNPLHFESKQ